MKVRVNFKIFTNGENTKNFRTYYDDTDTNQNCKILDMLDKGKLFFDEIISELK